MQELVNAKLQMEVETRMILKFLPSDKFFRDSPFTGDPRCICSRCCKPIEEDELAVRIFVGKEGEYVGEYRYHPSCIGIKTFEDDDIDDFDSEV